MYKLITVLIYIIFGCIAMISVIILENERLRTENRKLNEMVDTYKWEIEEKFKMWCDK